MVQFYCGTETWTSEKERRGRYKFTNSEQCKQTMEANKSSEQRKQTQQRTSFRNFAPQYRICTYPTAEAILQNDAILK